MTNEWDFANQLLDVGRRLCYDKAMTKSRNAFLNYLKVVLGEDSPNHPWAINNLVAVRRALGIGANEKLDTDEVVARLDGVENEQAFIEALLTQSTDEALMAYTPDMWAKVFESETFNINKLSDKARLRLTACVKERLNDLIDQRGEADPWIIADNAANYVSMSSWLPADLQQKYRAAINEKVNEVAEQLDVSQATRYADNIQDLYQLLDSKAPEAQTALQDVVKAVATDKILTPQAKQEIKAEDKDLQESLTVNGYDKKTAEAITDAKTNYRRQVALKVVTGHAFDQDQIEPAKTTTQKLRNMIKNTACAIKADPVKYVKNFAHGAVKSSVIQAATATANPAVAALAVAGVTAVYAVNQRRSMKKEMARTEIAKSKYHVNSLSELTPNQAKEFEAECATPDMKKRIRTMGRAMQLTPELKKQFWVKVGMEGLSNAAMAIPGGKALAGKVLGGDGAAAKMLAGAAKSLISSPLQSAKYYTTQIFNARNRGATEEEIAAVKGTYLKNAVKTGLVAFAGRMAGTAVNTFATEFHFGDNDTTLTEKMAASHLMEKAATSREHGFLSKFPFFRHAKENPAAVAQIQTEEAAKVEMPDSVFAMNHPAEAAQGMAQPMNPDSMFEMNHPGMAHRGWNYETEREMDPLTYKQADLYAPREFEPMFTMDKAGNHILDPDSAIPAGTHWDKNGWLARENGSLYRNEDGNFSRLADAKFAVRETAAVQETSNVVEEVITAQPTTPTMEPKVDVIEPAVQTHTAAPVEEIIEQPVYEAVEQPVEQPVYEEVKSVPLPPEPTPVKQPNVIESVPLPDEIEYTVDPALETQLGTEQVVEQSTSVPLPDTDYAVNPTEHQDVIDNHETPAYQSVNASNHENEVATEPRWTDRVQDKDMVTRIGNMESILNSAGMKQNPKNVDALLADMKTLYKNDPESYERYEQAAAVLKRHLRNQDHTHTEFEKQGYTKIGNNTYVKSEGLTDITIVDKDGDGTISAGDESTTIMGSQEFRDNVNRYGYNQALKMSNSSYVAYSKGTYGRTPADWDPQASPEKVIDEIKIEQGYRRARNAVADMDYQEVRTKLDDVRGEQTINEFYGKMSNYYGVNTPDYRRMQAIASGKYEGEEQQTQIDLFLAGGYKHKDLLNKAYDDLRTQKLHALDQQYAPELTQNAAQQSTPLPMDLGYSAQDTTRDL